MFPGLPYCLFYDDKICRVSIDNLRLKYRYPGTAYDYAENECVPTVLLISDSVDRLLSRRYRSLYGPFLFDSERFWHPFKVGAYQTTFRLYNDVQGWSFSLLVGRYSFNSSCRNVEPEVVVDYNPNKIPPEVIRDVLLCLSTPGSVSSVVRFDLAFDFPIARSDVQLRPSSRRSYKLFREHGAVTEYQGVRSSHGSFKLYDKTKESGLVCDVTRLEITISGAYNGKIEKLYPDLGVITDAQLTFDFDSLPFEVRACILHPDLVDQLKSFERHTRKKIMEKLAAYDGYALLPASFPKIESFVADALRKYQNPGVYLCDDSL